MSYNNTPKIKRTRNVVKIARVSLSLSLLYGRRHAKRFRAYQIATRFSKGIVVSSKHLNLSSTHARHGESGKKGSPTEQPLARALGLSPPFARPAEPRPNQRAHWWPEMQYHANYRPKLRHYHDGRATSPVKAFRCSGCTHEA